MPAEHKVSAFSALGGEGSLAGPGTPKKEVSIGAGHGGRGWSRIVSEYTHILRPPTVERPCIPGELRLIVMCGVFVQT